MLDWKAVLDEIVEGEASLPPHVRALALPRIDGWEPGRVWCRWQPSPELVQPQGQIFGGYLAAVADEMLGMATATVLRPGDRFRTADSHVNYFRAVTRGPLRVEARVVHEGRSSLFVEGEFYDADDALVARASATQRVRRAS